MNALAINQDSRDVSQNYDDDELLTVEDVAQRLKVPRSWVYAAIRCRTKNKLPHIRIGRYIRFEEAAVRSFIDGNKQAYPASSRTR